MYECKKSEIYSDGRYLKSNPNWHSEDSFYKKNFVVDIINKNEIKFSTCADLGCGSGLVTELLAERYPSKHFVGYEPSPDPQFLIKSRKQLINLSYCNYDLLSSDDFYDLIVCLDVFEHIEDYYAFLRKLKERGRNFVFNIPLDMCAIKVVTTGIRQARVSYGHLHYFNDYTAIQTLISCGYSIEATKFSVGFLAVPPKSIKQILMLPIRLLSLFFGVRFASRLFGGISLVVYAK